VAAAAANFAAIVVVVGQLTAVAVPAAAVKAAAVLPFHRLGTCRQWV
jgi:hypothetical protein